MKDLFIATIFGITITILLSGCAYAVRYDGPYKGRVIDADTGQPIEGVVVLGIWYTITPGGGTHRYYDVQETVTDKNGEFEIEGLGLIVFSNIDLMNVLIFKAGYEYDSGPWVGLKERGWTGKYEESFDPVTKTKVLRKIVDPKKKVIWEGEKAIIPLRKLTMEERKKQRSPDYPSEAPEEKIRLMLKEIDKDDKERSLPTRRGIWRGEKYE